MISNADEIEYDKKSRKAPSLNVIDRQPPKPFIPQETVVLQKMPSWGLSWRRCCLWIFWKSPTNHPTTINWKHFLYNLDIKGILGGEISLPIHCHRNCFFWGCPFGLQRWIHFAVAQPDGSARANWSLKCSKVIGFYLFKISQTPNCASVTGPKNTPTNQPHHHPWKLKKQKGNTKTPQKISLPSTSSFIGSDSFLKIPWFSALLLKAPSREGQAISQGRRNRQQPSHGFARFRRKRSEKMTGY